MVIDFGNEKRFLFSCEAHPEGLEVLRFSGVEGIGRPFEFQVTLVSGRPDISFDELVNKRAALLIRGREQDRHVKGIVNSFELVRIHERHTIYQASLVPPHARLGLRRTMRIFQGQTTRQIVEQVLKEHGITALKWDLTVTYGPRDYCVQYRETDLDFVQRLLEEEGIAYHFEHTDSELRTHFCDHSARGDISGTPQVIYKEDRSMVTDREAVHDLTYTQQLCTGAVELRDYDFKRPGSRVGGTSKGVADHLEVYDYPGEFTDAYLGGRLARARLQELEQERVTASGASDCNRLVPGYAFLLGGRVRRHPRAELNRWYLLTSVRHEGDQPLVLEEEGDGGAAHYHNTFSVIPAEVVYRPPRVTRRPRVLGTQTATVTGPKGEEIYTDRYGRVQVQFHWDRDGAGSCWIRVSQSWAGAGFGLLFIPRVGQEVLVRFIDGDPDRPVITGKVYNGQQTVPYRLPAGKTRSTIRTSSSPGGGGFNEIRFEDKAGREELFVHAQKNYTHWVDNDHTATIKRDRTEQVEFDDSAWISNDRLVRVTETSTHEANRIFIPSDKKVRLVVGKSFIELTPAEIKMRSPQIELEAEGTFSINGATVTFDGAAAATASPTPLLDKHKDSKDISMQSAGGKLFVDGVSGKDVRQGGIGDCYLMAGMAAVAHSQPQLIEKMFEKTDSGDYRVKFHEEQGSLWWKETVPKSTVIDDKVPKRGGATIYGESTEGSESWVSLAEKGYAETFGGGKGYEGVGNGGNPGTAMARMTGWEADRTVLLWNKGSTWETLKDASANNYPTTASSLSKDDKIPKSSGVVGHHAYTVTGVSEKDGKKMVNLRNPWGGTGSYTDSDGRKVELGEFSVPYDTFYESFSGIDVLKPPGE